MLTQSREHGTQLVTVRARRPPDAPPGADSGSSGQACFGYRARSPCAPADRCWPRSWPGRRSPAAAGSSAPAGAAAPAPGRRRPRRVAQAEHLLNAHRQHRRPARLVLQRDAAAARHLQPLRRLALDAPAICWCVSRPCKRRQPVGRRAAPRTSAGPDTATAAVSRRSASSNAGKLQLRHPLAQAADAAAGTARPASRPAAARGSSRADARVRQHAGRLLVVGQRGRRFFQHRSSKRTPPPGDDAFRSLVEGDFDGGADLRRRQPVALHRRRLADQRFGLAGIDVDADEQLRLGDAARRGQPDAAAADHDAAPPARLAPPGQPIRERRQQAPAATASSGSGRGRLRRSASPAASRSKLIAGPQDEAGRRRGSASRARRRRPVRSNSSSASTRSSTSESVRCRRRAAAVGRARTGRAPTAAPPPGPRAPAGRALSLDQQRPAAGGPAAAPAPGPGRSRRRRRSRRGGAAGQRLRDRRLARRLQPGEARTSVSPRHSSCSTAPARSTRRISGSVCSGRARCDDLAPQAHADAGPRPPRPAGALVGRGPRDRRQLQPVQADGRVEHSCRARPVSTTPVTPSTVTDVSATFVASTTLRRGLRQQRRVLLLRRQVAVQRQHAQVALAGQRLERARRLANFAKPGRKTSTSPSVRSSSRPTAAAAASGQRLALRPRLVADLRPGAAGPRWRRPGSRRGRRRRPRPPASPT